MIRIAIIEDELPAIQKLKRFIAALEEPTEVIGEMGSIAEAIDFLQSSPVDLLISDIQLQDGTAFEIYQQVSISCPVIFTTAYDQFWMNAFETNGIDYLLKPFTKERFLKAWNKFLLLRKSEKGKELQFDNLSRLLEQHLSERKYKKRFTVQISQRIYLLEVESIAFFEAKDGLVLAFDREGKKHMLNEATLREIENQLNPADFYRLNRSELINKNFIEKVERFSKNILAVKLKGYPAYYKTSQATTASFREWLDQG